MANVNGRFITFEGSDGCGKSTQVEELKKSLENAGCNVLTVREPGGTPLGEELRHLLKYANVSGKISIEAELLLFAASRAQLTREVILPALKEGKIVIADRYRDSTTVYQGVGRNISADIVEIINDFACYGCMPDLTIILDMDSEASMKRAMRRVKPVGSTIDRMEQEPVDFYNEVRKGYLNLAATYPDRICVINADRSESVIADEIYQIVSKKIYGIS